MDQVVALYAEPFRYLKELELEFPVAKGKFHVGEAIHAPGLEHVAAGELQYCLNQLTYAAFGYWLTQKQWTEIPIIEPAMYGRLMKENMFVVEQNWRFRKQIPRQRFDGEIKFERGRKMESVYFARLTYEFHDKSAMGDVSVALNLYP